jgi:hypothetical protein
LTRFSAGSLGASPPLARRSEVVTSTDVLLS